MEIVFADATLALIESDVAGETRLPVAIIKSARRKLTVLRAAVNDRSLRNWKSLNYEEFEGDREGMRSIRLKDQYRMVFILSGADPPKITVLSVKDHY